MNKCHSASHYTLTPHVCIYVFKSIFTKKLRSYRTKVMLFINKHIVFLHWIEEQARERAS